MTTFAAKVRSRPVAPARARHVRVSQIRGQGLGAGRSGRPLGRRCGGGDGFLAALGPGGGVGGIVESRHLGAKTAECTRRRGGRWVGPFEYGEYRGDGHGSSMAPPSRATVGLCRAWRAGRPRLPTGTAYRNLAAAAGGTGTSRRIVRAPSPLLPAGADRPRRKTGVQPTTVRRPKTVGHSLAPGRFQADKAGQRRSTLGRRPWRRTGGAHDRRAAHSTAPARAPAISRRPGRSSGRPRIAAGLLQ